MCASIEKIMALEASIILSFNTKLKFFSFDPLQTNSRKKKTSPPLKTNPPPQKDPPKNHLTKKEKSTQKTNPL